MKTLPRVVISGLGELVVLGSLLFVPAGTLDFWQAWALLVLFVVATWIPSLYLLRANSAGLQRRTRGGPTAETRAVQKAVMGGWWLSLAAAVVVSALDHRFGWSRAATPVCVVGDVLVATGLGVMMLVLVQNSHASAVVRVEAGQKVVSTGLYALVRHPMYTGNVIVLAGIPPALGSYWGLVFVIPGLVVLTLRIRDEEKLLQQELDGYREYTRKVRYRLVPLMW